jgi:hypothetical protein
MLNLAVKHDPWNITQCLSVTSDEKKSAKQQNGHNYENGWKVRCNMCSKTH